MYNFRWITDREYMRNKRLREVIHNIIYNAASLNLPRYILLFFDFFAVYCRNAVCEFAHLVARLQGYAVLEFVELFSLFAGKFGGDFDFHLYVEIARAVHRFNALAAHTESRARRISEERRVGKEF